MFNIIVFLSCKVKIEICLISLESYLWPKIVTKIKKIFKLLLERNKTLFQHKLLNNKVDCSKLLSLCNINVPRLTTRRVQRACRRAYSISSEIKRTCYTKKQLILCIYIYFFLSISGLYGSSINAMIRYQYNINKDRLIQFWKKMREQNWTIAMFYVATPESYLIFTEE